MNKITAKQFREQGYLQELNRQFLHPLGLALEVVVNYETGDEYFGEVWDYRDDPEGMRFSEGEVDTQDFYIKASRIMNEQHQKKIQRFKLLGYNIQPHVPIYKGDENYE